MQILTLPVPSKRSRRRSTTRALLVLPASVEKIAREVASKHRSRPEIILAKDNTQRPMVAARREVMRRVKAEVLVAGRAANYNEIARWLGVHSTTVMEACGAIPPSTERRRAA
jgi:hypothetical protein